VGRRRGGREEERLWQPEHPGLPAPRLPRRAPRAVEPFTGQFPLAAGEQPAAGVKPALLGWLPRGLRPGALTPSAGGEYTLTENTLLQAEQQLVDCAQAFNNHGCSG